MRIVSWFSCGASSAVATKRIIEKACKRPSVELVVARCVIPEEHPDNDRFAAECSEWFGVPILDLRSPDYAGCTEVWEARRFMSSPKGAPCTTILKRDVRKAFEAEWKPDVQVFGFTAEEQQRAVRFRDNHPGVFPLFPLIEDGVTKGDCFEIVGRAGIELPEMYRLGFRNNNCIGCVKASSPDYWLRVRREFPEVFAARADQSRRLGARLVRETKGRRQRFFLDELPDDAPGEDTVDLDCSIMCITEGQ